MTSTPGSPGERFADDARRYRLDSRIATGGMGEVWRGTDTTLGRQVAVKLLKTEYADDPTFRARFQTEAQHAASLHHPGVAGVFDFGEARSRDGSGMPLPFLVMELVDGQPLSALLRGGRPMDPAAVRTLLAQAADAIGAAHAAGIVHRDVKPANLLVTPDRSIKITDFGIARATDGLGLTGTGQVMGTPQYLSPEQARGSTATPASDVYSLGVVAFECLAGRRPFQADSPVATALSHLNDPVPDLPASVPADLARVVRRALAKDPAERYPDATAFAAALRDPARGGGAPVPPVVPPVSERTEVLTGVAPAAAPLPDPTPTPASAPATGTTASSGDGGRRSPWGPVLLLLVLAALVAVIVLLLTNGGGEDDPATSPTPSSTPSSASPTPTSSAPTSEPTRVETFDLDESDYVGRDVDDVVAELTDLGLDVDTERVANPGDADEDSVSAVTPTRDLSEGDNVTVSYYDAPPAPSPTPTTEAPSETPTPTDPGTTPTTPSTGDTGTADPTPPASTDAPGEALPPDPAASTDPAIPDPTAAGLTSEGAA